MKIQSITPIFKKGDKSDPGNYRPISLTSHLIRIFERVIIKKLVCHLESNSILSSKQHGFRKGRSCLTHVLRHIDDIIQSLLNGNDHDVIYLDFTKAFEKVDHEILVHKLRQCGVQGKLLKWIEQFLTDRKQFVLSGVPQGSVLGPIRDSKFEYLAYRTASSKLLEELPFTAQMGSLQHSIGPRSYPSEQCQRTRCSPQPRHEMVFASYYRSSK